MGYEFTNQVLKSTLESGINVPLRLFFPGATVLLRT